MNAAEAYHIAKEAQAKNIEEEFRKIQLNILNSAKQGYTSALLENLLSLEDVELIKGKFMPLGYQIIVHDTHFSTLKRVSIAWE